MREIPPVRFLRCLLGYLLALVATAALLYQVRPEDEAYKEAFEGTSSCNVLFVGPSYIKVGLNTQDFEDEARALAQDHAGHARLSLSMGARMRSASPGGQPRPSSSVSACRS